MPAATIAQSIPKASQPSWVGSITTEETEELIHRAKIGDARAFETLYREYVGIVYKFVMSRVQSKQRGEDVVAEVFVRALKNINRFEFRGIEFSAWLVRIARNLIVDQAKSSYVNLEISCDVTPEVAVGDTCEVAMASLDAEVLRAALDRMVSEHNMVLTLRFIRSLSVNETAEVMKKTPGAVRVLQYRALKAMKRELDHSFPQLATIWG